jgi:hypothetical protein
LHVASLRALQALENESDGRELLEAFIAARLHEAGEWASPRRSDGIPSFRVVERNAALLRVCGQIWEIDQTRHLFWLDIRWEREAESGASWTLLFDIDSTGMSPRRLRQAFDLLVDQDEVRWRVSITGQE